MIGMVEGGLDPKKQKLLLIVGGVIVLVIIGLFAWRPLWNAISPQSADQDTAARITKEVSAIFLAPDEQPTVRLLQDKSKLASQTFYARAENGDYVLAYEKAKMALIYREKINKIINVGPIAPDQPKQ